MHGKAQGRDAVTPTRWRGHAFGLSIDSDVTIDGCESSGLVGTFPGVRIEETPTVANDGEAGELLGVIEPPGGPWTARLYARGGQGYVFVTRHSGAYAVAASGDHIQCAPAGARWRWQRLLAGQVLPFVAGLHGRAVLHGSAVRIEGAAVVILGGTGSGKSSLAAELILRGATFIADDAVCVEPATDQVVAHAGFGLLSMRQLTKVRMAEGAVTALGRRVGGNRHVSRIAVGRCETPQPVVALCWLAPGDGRKNSVTPMQRCDPRRLLGSAFNVCTPGAQLAQLEVSAALASSARCYDVQLPVVADYGNVADLLLREVTR
jgi:hypothetical protein